MAEILAVAKQRKFCQKTVKNWKIMQPFKKVRKVEKLQILKPSTKV